VLSCRYRRTVARDNTVRLGARWAQIPRGPRGRSYAGCRVEARECLDGHLLIYGQGDVCLVAQSWTGPEFVLRPRRAPHPLRRPSRGASRSASEAGGAISLFPPRAPFHAPRRRPLAPRGRPAPPPRTPGASRTTRTCSIAKRLPVHAKTRG
jgi:hypothetical protein